MGKKWAYLFNEVKGANTKEKIFLLGNKGAQLAEMTSIGLPVPPGFTITTEACNEFNRLGKKWPEGLEKQVKEKLAEVEEKTGKKFGNPENPLLVSVRSGSYVSMPGMMDTVLNLGLNEKTVKGLAKKIGERAAWDSYRRLIQMFGNVVMGVSHEEFEAILGSAKEKKGVKDDTGLEAEDLKEVGEKYLALYKEKAGKPFPQEPGEQLKLSINAVFGSWNNPRAVSYRRINNLRNDAGTAVNVQAMVFGNMGADSGTGVGFTRNPATGKKEHYGEYLLNAQGEDVVAGIRTPKHIDEMKKDLPEAYKELVKVYKKLDSHYRDMQDFEFTVEKGKLFLLQSRKGKRTAQAAVKIAVDLVKEKLIDKRTAVLRIKPEQLDQLLHKQLDPEEKKKASILAKGLPASPGAAVGKSAFTAEKAKEMAEAGEKAVLVRTETSPEDIEGMNSAQGILTARGGMTSHAAVVARGMGKCCVAGCGEINVKEKEKKFLAKGKEVKEGDWVSLDGSTGEVFKGQLKLTDPKPGGEFKELMGWADSFRKLKVRTNADTPKDAKIAREFGAEGIGLCRTEHMFFGEERIKAMREMILARDAEGRKKALAKLLPFQKKDFEGIFEAMNGLPVTIRLLDPPLHEFLPEGEKEIRELAESTSASEEEIRNKINSLHEFNPMLGFRGCRLGIIYPEISEMQVEAIITAAIESNLKGKKAVPEIMVPVLAHAKEMEAMKKIIDKKAGETMKKLGEKVQYTTGVMMELPRACLTADEIAEFAEFFSFGTNDLTQTTFGFSRDDSGAFIPAYMEKGILERDPFQALDAKGVGELIKISIEKGRKTRKNLKTGICGEHGGEPSSIEFCHSLGLNYVSCSPYRVPIARLAAAQAAIKNR